LPSLQASSSSHPCPSRPDNRPAIPAVCLRRHELHCWPLPAYVTAGVHCPRAHASWRQGHYSPFGSFGTLGLCSWPWLPASLHFLQVARSMFMS
jgi:hypothetical protein